jgi:hypothetical protein
MAYVCAKLGGGRRHEVEVAWGDQSGEGTGTRGAASRRGRMGIIRRPARGRRLVLGRPDVWCVALGSAGTSGGGRRCCLAAGATPPPGFGARFFIVCWYSPDGVRGWARDLGLVEGSRTFPVSCSRDSDVFMNAYRPDLVVVVSLVYVTVQQSGWQ